jgi:hypothetical protein
VALAPRMSVAGRQDLRVLGSIHRCDATSSGFVAAVGTSAADGGSSPSDPLSERRPQTVRLA